VSSTYDAVGEGEEGVEVLSDVEQQLLDECVGEDQRLTDGFVSAVRQAVELFGAAGHSPSAVQHCLGEQRGQWVHGGRHGQEVSSAAAVTHPDGRRVVLRVLIRQL